MGFDQKQLELLSHVLEQVKQYYTKLYKTAPRYRYPLSLSQLCKMCKRSGAKIAMAIRVLANTVTDGQDVPELFYERVQARRNGSHRPYQITLRDGRV